MSASNQSQPLKLNYAKARMKSKTKNQAQSQQKMAFQGESSVDIFAHLNQDNLNYIKKQLKNKKSINSHERVKSSNIVEISSKKSQEPKYQQKDKAIQQKKMYQKYKNENQVTERDSRDEQTMRQTQVDDDFTPEIQNDKGKYGHEKQRNNYLGLQPPPSISKIYKQSLPSVQSQNLKTGSIQNNSLQRKGNLDHKNNFLDYQLKSQDSQNQFANSQLSVQNHLLSDNFSTNFKASQFIDYLQNYIQELNLTPGKRATNKLDSNRNYSQEIGEQAGGKIKNFKKSKNNLKSYEQNTEKVQDSYRSENNQSYQPFSLKRINKTKFIQFPLGQQQKKPQFQLNREKNIQDKHKQHQEQDFSNNSKNNHYLTKYQYQQQKNYQNLVKQLQKQRYYCTKLALELQRYKQNQGNYHKQINILNKTVGLLKIQIQNLKQIYQDQMAQTKKIISYINIQNESSSRRKFSDNQKNSDNKSAQRKSQNNCKIQHKRVVQQKQLKTRNFLLRKSQSQSLQFQDLMKFPDQQPIYRQLNPRTFNLLAKDFEKGQQNYYRDKQNSLRNTKQTFRKSYQDERLSEIYQNQENYSSSLYNNDKDKYRNMYQQRNQNNYNQTNYMNRNRRDSGSNNERIIQKMYKLSNTQDLASKNKYVSSLQKLKREYQKFKTKAHIQKHQSKKSYRKVIRQQLSPQQFSHIFVK